MGHFHKEFPDWSLHGEDHIMLTYIETSGKDVEEMVDNAIISLENWHGEPVRHNWTVGDLPTKDFLKIEQMFWEHLCDNYCEEGPDDD